MSIQDPEAVSGAFDDVEIADLISPSKAVLIFLEPITKPSLSSSSEFLFSGGNIRGPVLSSVSNLPVPINSSATLPMECESDVGGVLIMLLEPVVADAKADEMEEEDEEVEGELIIREGTAVIPLANKTWLTFCSFLGAEADKPLGTLGMLELRLPTVPL